MFIVINNYSLCFVVILCSLPSVPKRRSELQNVSDLEAVDREEAVLENEVSLRKFNLNVVFVIV